MFNDYKKFSEFLNERLSIPENLIGITTEEIKRRNKGVYFDYSIDSRLYEFNLSAQINFNGTEIMSFHSNLSIEEIEKKYKCEVSELCNSLYQKLFLQIFKDNFCLFEYENL